MKRVYFSSLLIILCLVGCDKNPVIQESKPENLISLEVGNQWTYQRTGFDSTGAIRSTDTILRQVEFDTTLLGQTWFKTSWGYIKNKEDGIWFYYGKSSNVQGHEYETLTYPYPGELNKEFRPLATDATITLVSTDEQYSTPSETYSCYHYQLAYDNINYVQDVYIAPGIGFIKWEDGITLPSGLSYTTVKYELLSHSKK